MGSVEKAGKTFERMMLAGIAAVCTLGASIAYQRDEIIMIIAFGITFGGIIAVMWRDS